MNSAHGKLNKHATTKPLVLMGARPLSPTHGRFLTIDPIEGGCANNYVYVHGDPVNSTDLSGRSAQPACDGLVHMERYGTIRVRVGETQDGRPQLGVSYEAHLRLRPGNQGAVIGSNWSVYAPSLGVSRTGVGTSFRPGNELDVRVNVGRVGRVNPSQPVTISIQYFWIGHTATTELGGSHTLSADCLL